MKRCKYEKSNKRYNVLDKNEKTYIAVNAENRASKVDLKLILAEKFRIKKIPRFALHLLEKMTGTDKINKLFASAPGKKNMEFTDACMKYLDVTCHVVGEEHLPADDSKLIFACNHPQGGIEAICIASILGRKYGNSIYDFS